MKLKQTAFKNSFSQNFLFLTRTWFRNLYQGINKSCVRAFNLKNTLDTAKSAVIYLYRISSLVVKSPTVIKNNKNGQNLFSPVRILNTRRSMHILKNQRWVLSFSLTPFSNAKLQIHSYSTPSKTKSVMSKATVKVDNGFHNTFSIYTKHQEHPWNLK